MTKHIKKIGFNCSFFDISVMRKTLFHFLFGANYPGMPRSVILSSREIKIGDKLFTKLSRIIKSIQKSKTDIRLSYIFSSPSNETKIIAGNIRCRISFTLLEYDILRKIFEATLKHEGNLHGIQELQILYNGLYEDLENVYLNIRSMERIYTGICHNSSLSLGKDVPKKNDYIKKEHIQNTPGTRQVLFIKDVPFPFRWCPPGRFMMGTPFDKSWQYSDETEHEVCISKGFWILETPMTRLMFYSIIDDIPCNVKSIIENREIFSANRNDRNTPLHSITWNEANICCEALSKFLALPNEEITLPTEAQWEYACKGGLASSECNSKEYISETAWTLENSNNQIHQAGQKHPNPWGIYDMQGNLYEWCYDWYGDYKSNDKADPIGNTCGNMKTIRGGSWKYVWHESRSTSRGHFIPSYCHEDTGFRPVIICRVPQKQ